MTHSCYKIYIHGKVQGVGFRRFTQKKAQTLGIVGYVSNEEDQTVYIEAYGQENKLDVFLEYCKTGPKSAAVEAMVVNMTEAESPRADFVIQPE